MTTFLYLIFGHYLGDYGLQSDYMAKAKGTCLHVLFAHASIQAGTVLLATNRPELALIELGMHGITDWLKARNILTLNQDQLIHLTCRVVYACLTEYL